jgi:V/A-type H+/Na+-transporting ATPase subunit A
MKEENLQGKIIRVSGPLVQASGMSHAKMYEVVKVSKEKLLGEIIELKGDTASIQVYEDTSGIGPGDVVLRTKETMSVVLGPGLLGSIYDGIQRPLNIIAEKSGGPFIARGIEASGISLDNKWKFKVEKKVGDVVEPGDVIGSVQETTLISHRIMIPPSVSGVITKLDEGEATVTDIIAEIKLEDGTIFPMTMLQRWPIRKPRPIKSKIFPETPLITGIRIIDTLFPIAKGGAGSIPGPFGSGKTVTQQSIAKYCDAEVIVYVGCGERGNEMTEVLNEFPHIIDPNSGESLIKRTVMIANTSNMPVAAREASVYTGITIAEYFRDMGYSVALMADSTSRWAEAMREISGRMEEMPGEEGYPAYLASRTAEFYERAGFVKCLGKDDKTGALTAIGAVSPPGGDLSEPVSQATLRVTKCFWGLDAGLAYKKHFPSINWLNSYSLYVDNVLNFWGKSVATDFAELRSLALDILQKEAKLLEIVRLVGMEALSNEERLTLEVARSLREDFLFQNAFDSDDAYTPLGRQYQILKSILALYMESQKIIGREDFDFVAFKDMKSVSKLAHIKEMKEEKEFEKYREDMKEELGTINKQQ